MTNLREVSTPTTETDVNVTPSKTASPSWTRPSASEFLTRYGVVVVLGVLVVACCLWEPNSFATAGNFKTMVNSQSVVLLLAGIATLVLRTGDFDLSIASMMVFSACIVARLTVNDHMGYGAAFVIILLVGLLIGTINALLVVKVKIDAFIVTLGMLTLLEGLSYWVTDSQVIGSIPAPVLSIARDSFLGLQLTSWFAWALIAILWYVYERTPLGRYMLFIGGNREAARLAGIRVDAIRMGTFMVSAVLSAAVGFLLAGQLGAIDPSIASQYLLQPFAAAYLGATTIKVGRFNALGTMAGMYLLVVGITGLELHGAQQWVTDVFNGAALIIAVTVARVAGRRA